MQPISKFKVMKYTLKYILPLAIVLFAACNNFDEMNSKKENATIFPQGEKITNENFTGTAYLHMMVKGDSLNDVTVGNVTFEPGARTNWHSHPAGQIILVTDGVGYYQEKGQPKQTLRKGDVVNCPADIEHWHGASADSAFVQVAVSSNRKGGAVWLQPVTDEEYSK